MSRLKHLLVGSKGTVQQRDQGMDRSKESNGKNRGSIEEWAVQEEQRMPE